MADYAEMIANLLAKAESTTEGEAELLRDKAYTLMMKYAIDQAEIDAKRTRDGQATEEIVREPVVFHGIFKDAFLYFTHDIVKAFRTMQGYVEKNILVARFVDDAKPKTRGHAYYIVGYESDVQQAKLLITSLQLQAASALNDWWKTDSHASVIQGVGTPMEKFKVRREYIISFGNGAASRIRDRVRDAVQGSGTGTDLMLIDRGKTVQKWLDENMNLGTSRGRGMQRGSAASRAAGWSAGRKANTGESSIGPKRDAIGS